MTSPQPESAAQHTIHVTMATAWMPLSLTALSALVFTLDGSMNAIALPFIADEFGASPAGAVWVSVGLQFMILGLALPIGSLATSLGRRRLFTIGLGVFVLGLIGSYLSPNLPALIGARVVQGLGCALFLSTRNAIGMEGFPPERRGMALGIIIAAVGLGAGSGPLIGGQLIDEFGWRSVYVAVAPLALITVMLSYFLLRREERLPIANFDIMGSTLGFVGLGALLVALNRTSDWGATSPGIIGLATLGLVLMAAFVWREGRVLKPVLDLAIFRSKAVVVSSMGLVLQVMGNSTTTLVLPFFLVRSLELSSTASGALFAIAPGCMFAGGLVGGKLSARLGVGPVMLAGMVAQVIGVGLLLFVDENASLLHIALALVVMGSGAGMYQTSAGSAQMNAIPPGHIGTASALFIAVIMMAGSTGATLGGILMSSGDSSRREAVIQISQVASNYHNVAIAGTVLLVLGLMNALYYQFRISRRRPITEVVA